MWGFFVQIVITFYFIVPAIVVVTAAAASKNENTSLPKRGNFPHRTCS
jgi:uncharacterized membrane protein YkvI